MKNLKEIEDPVKRRAYFIGLLSREVKREGGKDVIVVGGEALELYTQGSYSTGDIDIKGQKKILEKVLKKFNFKKVGRLWINEYLDIYIDWQGENLDEGEEGKKRVNTIIIEDELEIKVLSFEDLIIDRLNSAKWWGDMDGLMWAKVLVDIKKKSGQKVDLNYLKKRAKAEKVEDLLEKLLTK
jgi:hypothetical protein